LSLNKFLAHLFLRLGLDVKLEYKIKGFLYSLKMNKQIEAKWTQNVMQYKTRN
jgi:hypothetical protein